MRIVLLAALALGCGESDRMVPFRVHEEPETSAEPEPDIASPEPISRALAGEGGVEHAGARWDVAERALYGVLELDSDSDGDTDLVGIAASPASTGTEIVLLYGRRDESAFSTRVIGRTVVENCVDPAPSAALTTEGSEFIAASVTLSCGVELPAHAVMLASREASPRLRERFLARDLPMALAYGDRDADGHADVSVTLGTAPTAITVPFLNRPGGLGTDQTSLESSLGTLVEGMAEGSEEASDLFRAVCGPWARFSVGGTHSLECSREFIQRADTHHLSELAAEDLATAALQVTPAVAMEFLATTPHQTPSWRRIADAPRARDSLSIRDGELQIAGTTSAFHLASGVERTLETPALPAVVSPDLTRSARLTDGRLRVIAGADGLSGFGAPAAETRLPQADRWWLIGWAPQGLLVFGRSRYVVPLSSDNVFLEPSPLDPTAPAPAPLRGARTTPSGDVFAVELHFGVLVFNGSRATLFRPEGWDEADGLPTALAVSASGDVIAIAKGGGVYAFSTGLVR